MKPQPIEVSLRDVLNEVVAALPAEVHPNIIIIGSLAAGYGLFRRDDKQTCHRILHRNGNPGIKECRS